LYPHWTQDTLSVNGVPIHYTRTGDGSKPPLVLLHGFSDHGLCWLRVACDLEADYDIILMDARGHGRSARVQPGEEIDQAADAAGLIQALGLNRPILGGHSMGAHTSANTAARFPELVRALLLEDPPWWDVSPATAPQTQRPDPYRDWLLTIPTLSDEAILTKCRTDSPTWAEVELPAWVESKRMFDLNFLHSHTIANRPWQAAVPAIGCPALLLTADTTRQALVSPSVAQQVATLNPLFQVKHIPGAGHNIRRENYAEYIAAVKGFLSTVL
jgi:N-formylmaleamate deformylase